MSKVLKNTAVALGISALASGFNATTANAQDQGPQVGFGNILGGLFSITTVDPTSCAQGGGLSVLGVGGSVIVQDENCHRQSNYRALSQSPNRRMRDAAAVAMTRQDPNLMNALSDVAAGTKKTHTKCAVTQASSNSFKMDCR